jgi:hypothetical protein
VGSAVCAALNIEKSKQCSRSDPDCMFLGLPDPDPLVRVMDPDPSIIKATIVRKTLISTVFYFFMSFYL